MGQTATQENNNGSLATTEGATKPKKNRKMGLLPSESSVQEVTYQGKVIEELTWATLSTNRLFAVDREGKRLYFKKSRSSFVDLVTEEVTTNVPVNANNKIYRVSLT